MLVWKITTLNDDTGEELSRTGWEQVPDEAQNGGAFRLLTKEYGRAAGKLLDVADARRSYGWKLHQIRLLPSSHRKFNHVAIVQLGWRQGKQVLAYDVKRGRPIAGTDANEVKYGIPPTQYPGQVERWSKERSPPADATPSRVPQSFTALKEAVTAMARINLDLARGDRTPKDAAAQMEAILRQLEAV